MSISKGLSPNKLEQDYFTSRGDNSTGDHSANPAYHLTEPPNCAANAVEERDMPPPLNDSEESDDNYDDPSPPKPTVESATALYITT